MDRRSRLRLSVNLRLAKRRHRRRGRRASTTKPRSAFCWPATRPTCIPNGAALGTTRFAMAQTGTDAGWVGPPTGSPCPAAGPWNLVDGWLRVEYQNAAGAWVGVTTEWLQLGFARGL